jgi:hypothetical protein
MIGDFVFDEAVDWFELLLVELDFLSDWFELKEERRIADEAIENYFTQFF